MAQASRARYAVRGGECPSCRYWKSETEQAIRQRQEVKALLDAVNSPEGIDGEWRRRAKAAEMRAAHAINQANTIRHQVAELRVEIVTHRDEVEKERLLRKSIARELWDVWSGLSDDEPVKAQLWAVWSQLA